MKLLDETLFSLTYSLLVILPVVLCRWDMLFTWWAEYRIMVMSESRVWRRTCWQGRKYCLLILSEHHSLLTFGRPQVQILLLETSDPDWFFVVFLTPLSLMQGHCLKLGHSCFLPFFLPSFLLSTSFVIPYLLMTHCFWHCTVWVTVTYALLKQTLCSDY